MGWFSDDSDQAQAYQQTQDDNQASLSHEVIAGAASYEAMKAYENHCNTNGDPGSHEKAKEILAGFTGAFVDREAETRGMNEWDKEKAKRLAREQAEQGYDQNNSNNY